METDARFFIAIAETGSISEAARREHLTQPALSQRLKRLETDLGCTLFDRSTSPLAPTHAGSVYLTWARKAVAEEDRMRAEVSAIAEGTSHRLRIGTSVPRGSGMLAEIIARFHAERPSCSLWVHEAGTPESHDQLLADGEIDLALLTPVPPSSPLIEGEPLCREQLLVIAPPSWKLPQDNAAASPGSNPSSGPDGSPFPFVRLADLADLPFIMPPKHLRQTRVITDLAESAGIRLNARFHSCSNELSLELVKQGLGICIAPNTFTFSQPAGSIARYGIREYPTGGMLYCSRRVGHTASEDEVAFMHILWKWVSTHPDLML